MPYRVRNVFLAVALAVLAAVLTTFYVANYKRTVQSDEENVSVVVAGQEIPAGTSGADAAAQGLFELREVPRLLGEAHRSRRRHHGEGQGPHRQPLPPALPASPKACGRRQPNGRGQPV